MVQLGMAWAFVRYSSDYIELEQRARVEGASIISDKRLTYRRIIVRIKAHLKKFT